MKNTQEHSIEDLYTKDPEISLNLLIESKSNKDLWITQMTKLLILNKIDKDVHQIYSLINQLKKGHIDILRKILKNHDIIDFEKQQKFVLTVLDVDPRIKQIHQLFDKLLQYAKYCISYQHLFSIFKSDLQKLTTIQVIQQMKIFCSFTLNTFLIKNNNKESQLIRNDGIIQIYSQEFYQSQFPKLITSPQTLDFSCLKNKQTIIQRRIEDQLDLEDSAIQSEESQQLRVQWPDLLDNKLGQESDETQKKDLMMNKALQGPQEIIEILDEESELQVVEKEMDIFFDGSQLVSQDFKAQNALFVQAQMSQGMSSLQRIIETRAQTYPQITTLAKQMSDENLKNYAQQLAELTYHLHYAYRSQFNLKINILTDILKYNVYENRSDMERELVRRALHKVYLVLKSLLIKQNFNRMLFVTPFSAKDYLGYQCEVIIENPKKKQKYYYSYHKQTAFIYGEAFIIQEMLSILFRKLYVYECQQLVECLYLKSNQVFRIEFMNALKAAEEKLIKDLSLKQDKDKFEMKVKSFN